MKRSIFWKILFAVGIYPFVSPFILSFTRMSTWTLLDWLVMYSFIYWPTYIVGILLIAFSVYKLIKNKQNPPE